MSHRLPTGYAPPLDSTGDRDSAPGRRHRNRTRSRTTGKGAFPIFPVTRSHPPASWPSAANSSICRTYRKSPVSRNGRTNRFTSRSCRRTADLSTPGTEPGPSSPTSAARRRRYSACVASSVSTRSARWYGFHPVCRRHRRTVLRSRSSARAIARIDAPSPARRRISSHRSRPDHLDLPEHLTLGVDRRRCAPSRKQPGCRRRTSSWPGGGSGWRTP